MRNFDDLSEREILALAISNEEEDARIYADFADGLHDDYPASAKVFDEMAAEENGHRRRLIDLFVAKFGEHIPLVRRQDIRGYIPQKPVWQHAAARHRHGARACARHGARRGALLSSGLDADDRRVDPQAARRPRRGGGQARPDRRRPRGPDPHHVRPRRRSRERAPAVRPADHPARPRGTDGRFGLDARAGVRRGLRDPQFVERFPGRLAASIGAGISMGFAEALSDDGNLSGRGAPLLRGLVCGLMTTAGGIGHTLPFLIPYFYTATVIAIIVVVIELTAIAWIQWRYMDAPPLTAAAKVMIGGALVLAAGILIGSS